MRPLEPIQLELRITTKPRPQRFTSGLGHSHVLVNQEKYDVIDFCVLRGEFLCMRPMIFEHSIRF